MRRHAGIALPHHLDPLAGGTPALAAHLLWAVSNSLRALLSLALARGRWDAVAVGAAAAIAAVGISVWARDGAARGRLRRALPWVGWGLAWFALASGTLALVHPLWCPDRTPYGAIGAGVAVAAGLGALRPALVAVLFALRLALLAAAPAPPRSITVAAPASGASVDFAHIARLQRLMRATRERVADAGPLPRGARVVWRSFPLESVYAFGGSRALRVWGGDSTLRWVRFAEFERNPALDVATIVEYEPDRFRQIARVDPEAMRSFLAADRPMREGISRSRCSGSTAPTPCSRTPRPRAFAPGSPRSARYAWAGWCVWPVRSARRGAR
ncbi:MAG: hypothetical protein A2W00_10110 [Candidatus Eisenbacteria bacterium RBG_16_71_46]|nr:MAG: hypothetical protein A2W00_10110 [Candidatus Eisenbacteria bacterium RBG_16_71_46]